MLTLDARVEDFDASDFIALREILGGFAPKIVNPGLISIVSGDRASKLLSSSGERFDPSGAVATEPLATLAARYDAPWAVRLDRRALAILSDRFALQLERTDGLLEQALKLAGTLRELAGEGLVETYPRDARSLYVPAADLVLRVLDAACPAGKTIVLGAFDGAEVTTLVALHRGEGGFDRVVGPAALRHEMGLISGDWTKDCKGLARAVELGVGPLAFGCFAQARTFRRLFARPAPGAWTSAVASRDVIFHPVAPALAVPFGVDVGRAALVMARDLATRFGVGSWLAGNAALGPALHRVREAAGRSDVERLLTLFGQFAGADLLSVLRTLLGKAPEVGEP